MSIFLHCYLFRCQSMFLSTSFVIEFKNKNFIALFRRFTIIYRLFSWELINVFTVTLPPKSSSSRLNPLTRSPARSTLSALIQSVTRRVTKTTPRCLQIFQWTTQLCLFFKQQHPETVNYEKILHIASERSLNPPCPLPQTGKEREGETLSFSRSFRRFSRHDPSERFTSCFQKKSVTRLFIHSWFTTPSPPRRVTPSRRKAFSSRLERGCAEKLKCENNVLFFISHPTPQFKGRNDRTVFAPGLRCNFS